MLSRHYVVQLCFECWLAPWDGDPGRTCKIENARRFSSRKQAEAALKAPHASIGTFPMRLLTNCEQP